MNIESFIEYTRNNLIPGNVYQEQSGQDETLWTSDDWTLAVAECLLCGPSNFNNERVHKLNYHRDIIVAAERKIKMIKELINIKDMADTIFVGEVGRGLDILLAIQVKDWKTIYCYDQFEYYEKYLKEFFLDYNIVYQTCRSRAVDVSMIKEPTILLMNMCKLEKHEYKLFTGCNNIVKIIRDGILF